MCLTQWNEKFKAKTCESGRLYIKQDITEDLKRTICDNGRSRNKKTERFCMNLDDPKI